MKARLARYREGELKQQWQEGRELPAFPLSAMAIRTGVGIPELWIATEGGGIVIYDGSTLRPDCAHGIEATNHHGDSATAQWSGCAGDARRAVHQRWECVAGAPSAFRTYGSDRAGR